MRAAARVRRPSFLGEAQEFADPGPVAPYRQDDHDGDEGPHDAVGEESPGAPEGFRSGQYSGKQTHML